MICLWQKSDLSTHKIAPWVQNTPKLEVVVDLCEIGIDCCCRLEKHPWLLTIEGLENHCEESNPWANSTSILWSSSMLQHFSSSLTCLISDNISCMKSQKPSSSPSQFPNYITISLFCFSPYQTIRIHKKITHTQKKPSSSSSCSSCSATN